MKIIGICGSLREGSYNKIILNYIGDELLKDIDFKIFDINYPLYNADINISNDLIMKQNDIKDADGIIIVTPEYNHSIPGVLKNFLDWVSLSEVKPFDNKKVAIVSASLGSLGGVRCQMDLREVLRCLNAKLIANPEVLIGSVHNKIDENGYNDEKGKELLKELVNQLINK